MRRVGFRALGLERGSSTGTSLGLRSGWLLAGVLAVSVAVGALFLVVPERGASRHVSPSAPRARLPLAAWGPVSRALGGDDPAYRATTAGAGLAVHNPRQRLTARFSSAGLSIQSRSLRLGLRLRGVGYGNDLRLVGQVSPTAAANQVIYRHRQVSEWYANGPVGLEQGFTLNGPPGTRSDGPLTVAIALSGNAHPALSRGAFVTFSHADASLSYRGLIATDSRGRTLPAWLELRGHGLRLHIRDVGARYPLRIDPFVQLAELTASDFGGALGSSVAISGNTIVASAPAATVNGHADQGAVYVFAKPATGWQNATETARLTASDGAPFDLLGGPGFFNEDDVGISGNTVVAGAVNATVDGHPGQGAVYVWVMPNGGWRNETQAAKLTASDGTMNADLGSSAAISGNTVVAGAIGAAVNGNAQEGAAYVFVRPKGGWGDETQTAKLTASDGIAKTYLGSSVAIQGTTVVAGAPTNFLPTPGAAYVFVRPTGGWTNATETAELTASNGNRGGQVGWSVAIDGRTVVAGAPCALVNGHGCQGAAYVFLKPKNRWQSEHEAAELTASDGSTNDNLGWGVGVSHQTVVAGAPIGSSGAGYVDVFAEPAGGWRSETQTAKVMSSDSQGATQFFGQSTAIADGTIVAGAPAVAGYANGGAAYVFGGTRGWVQTASTARSAARAARARAAIRSLCTRYAAGIRVLPRAAMIRRRCAAPSLGIGSLAVEHRARVAGGARLPLAARGAVSDGVGRADPAYRVSRTGQGFVASSPGQALRAQFSTAGVSVRAGRALLGIRLRGYGYGERRVALAAVTPTTRANRVTYRRSSVTEWYANGPVGLEQGFTLTERPPNRSAGPLTLALSLSGGASAKVSRRRDRVEFSHDGRSLTYRDLVASDARGRTLRSWIELSRGQLLLRIDDHAARYPLTIDPFIQQAGLTASDGPGGFLGGSVAISGNTIVASAPLTTVNGNVHEGAAFVFVKPKSGWAHATQVAELTASDGFAGEGLGDSAFSAFSFFFGAFGAGGNAVAISGNTVVVSAPAPGVVYVFAKPPSGWRDETETAKLTASTGDPLSAVAIDGGTIVAGAAASFIGNFQGAAYVFVEPTGGWQSATETAMLTSSDGQFGDGLGDSVAISGGTIVAGAPFTVSPASGASAGAAYVFAEPNGGWQSATETARLDASDGVSGDMLGVSLGVSGNTVVAGADDAFNVPQQGPGAAYVFIRPNVGWRSETQSAKLTASDGAPGALLGDSVAIQGNTITAAAPFATVNGNAEQGAGYVFLEPTKGWADETEAAKLTASDGVSNDVFAMGLGMSGNTVVSGAPGAAIHGHTGQGALYVFRKRHSRRPAHQTVDLHQRVHLTREEPMD